MKSIPLPAPKLVVIVVMSGNVLLDIAGPADVFVTAGKILAKSPQPVGGYEVCVAAPGHITQLPSSAGLQLMCATSVLDIRRPVDTLLIAGYNSDQEELEDYTAFYQWLGVKAKEIRRIGAVCVGTFALAKAGLLNGKRATTHWEYCGQLQACFPEVKVDPNPFFIKDDNRYTSGGVTSGMDLALALVEEDHGKDLAAQVSRKLVLYLKRPGSQASFSALLPGYAIGNAISGQLRTWIMEHLSASIGVSDLAAQMNMSTRNFSRAFTKETGISPAKFVEKLRVEVARKYLEDSSLSLETIAERCGLGSVVSMRRIFDRHLHLTPGDYRRTFRTSIARDFTGDIPAS
ncbi:GlxA family transcriptional regulator [Chitinophaga arvensicola]|uniref:Transcriptional regulator GlxA family, contains an amidase domain and an AraC-type DNA-binding HTH domain n=1 Tax=Chitinophaga arvensicola TaxID=29529 RepID=A0A1I0R9T9_9BACT|nr:helix-turn-helix domain-containing protein [Chitinophaga arvensicola]SEW37585.1 Transcriptional regulator GlxA family, contains an amidase domain and an AraC-type DNA-binding HTH domain [Chitinophaga arvensicola]